MLPSYVSADFRTSAAFPNIFHDAGPTSSRPHTTDFPQKVAFWKGNPRNFQGNLGWWNIILWPDDVWKGGFNYNVLGWLPRSGKTWGGKDETCEQVKKLLKKCLVWRVVASESPVAPSFFVLSHVELFVKSKSTIFWVWESSMFSIVFCFVGFLEPHWSEI